MNKLILIVCLLLSGTSFADFKENIRNTFVIVANEAGMGSGVVVASNSFGSYILTNKHVCLLGKRSDKDKELEGISEFKIFLVMKMNNKDANDAAQVVKLAINFDLCLLHTPLPNLPVVSLANKNPVVNEKLFSFVFPLDKNTFQEGKLLEYAGVSDMYMQISNLTAQQGSSGSGIFNKEGKLVGLVSGFVNENKKASKGSPVFSVPLEYIRMFLYELETK